MAQEPGADRSHDHFYGGQAVMEGVMMRGTDHYAVAVRCADGEIVVGERDIPAYASKWLKFPLIRGCASLVDSLVLGFASLQFSSDMLTAGLIAAARAKAAAEEPAPEAGEPPSGEAEPEGAEAAAPPEKGSRAGERVMMGSAMVLATVLGLGLFVLLPTLLVDWVMGAKPPGGSYGNSILRNLTEGGLRLLVIVLYILAISLLGYVRRVFQYHGAEHATINCYEAGEAVTSENVMRYSALHPRCGTAFLLVVIVVKIILGCFFGWPTPLLRSLIRLALLPVVAALAYEVIRWAGRHRASLLSKVLAGPGLLMQVLTTRRPSEDQVEVAIHALSAVASEVPLPAGWPVARRVPMTMKTATTNEER